MNHTTPSAPVGVVWDFGGVLVDWNPRPAIAAGVGEDEADRFLTEFDFGAWNMACDAGRSWQDALAVLEQEAPHFLPAGQAYVTHFPKALVGEVPGTSAIMRDLHRAGLRQFGLTNWSDELFHDYAPQRFDVMALLEHIVVSGTEKLAKPDPAIYRLVEERSGVPLTQLLFVDDRADNVAAANELGMDGIVFTDATTLRSDLQDRGFSL